MSQQINLFNPVFLKQKKHFSAKTMLQALGLIWLSVFAVYGLQMYQLSTLRSQERAMRAQAEHVSQQLMNAGAGQNSRGSRVLEDELRRAEADLKLLQDVSVAVQVEVDGNAPGFSRYLSAFARQPVSGLWLTGVTVAGDDLEVRGRALRAELLPVFIRRLGREDVLRGKGFSELSVVARTEPVKGTQAQPESTPEALQRFVEFSLGTHEKRSPTP
jgi:hypothetical protein